MAEIEKKVQERMLKWYGHVIGREEQDGDGNERTREKEERKA